MRDVVLCGISPAFARLSHSSRQVAHVLLTRSPLYSEGLPPPFSHDLHVLSTPPAFVLSQDQTLQIMKSDPMENVTFPSGKHRN